MHIGIKWFGTFLHWNHSFQEMLVYINLTGYRVLRHNAEIGQSHPIELYRSSGSLYSHLLLLYDTKFWNIIIGKTMNLDKCSQYSSELGENATNTLQLFFICYTNVLKIWMLVWEESGICANLENCRTTNARQGKWSLNTKLWIVLENHFLVRYFPIFLNVIRSFLHD